jgi:hypothetical protein
VTVHNPPITFGLSYQQFNIILPFTAGHVSWQLACLFASFLSFLAGAWQGSEYIRFRPPEETYQPTNSRLPSNSKFSVSSAPNTKIGLH